MSQIISGGGGLVGLPLSTSYETAARFLTGVAGSGAVNFTNGGIDIATGATGSSTGSISWTQAGLASSNALSGAPLCGCRLGLSVKGTDGNVYFGTSGMTINAAGQISFIQNHIGFKITWAGSGVASLFATVGSGANETASAALTTIVAGDELDLIFQINGYGPPLSSVDFYWRKNGQPLSSPTNLSAFLPANAPGGLQIGISNVGVASASNVGSQGMSYVR